MGNAIVNILIYVLVLVLAGWLIHTAPIGEDLQQIAIFVLAAVFVIFLIRTLLSQRTDRTGD